MEKIKEIHKKIIIILILIIIFLLMFTFELYKNRSVKAENNERVSKVVKKEKKKVIKKEDKIINYFSVDVKGEVNSPGVYSLEEGKRIIDAINMAGGVTEKSDTSIINLSKKLEDEMVIIIYSKNELKEYKEKQQKIEEINKELDKKVECPDNFNNGCIKKENDSNKKTDKILKENTESKNQLISINTASKEELKSISGLGESKAEAIIKYREENGDFEKIEDIKNVSGIGDSLYEKIKERITV